MEKPIFKHDCSSCKFLGTYKDRDLYVCHTTLVARFGNGGHEYESGIALIPHNLWIAEAARLAEERGLINEKLINKN
jgi:hypothetical protein